MISITRIVDPQITGKCTINYSISRQKVFAIGFCKSYLIAGNGVQTYSNQGYCTESRVIPFDYRGWNLCHSVLGGTLSVNHPSMLLLLPDLFSLRSLRMEDMASKRNHNPAPTASSTRSNARTDQASDQEAKYSSPKITFCIE